MISKKKKNISGLIAILSIVLIPAGSLITSRAIQEHLDRKWTQRIGERLHQQAPDASLGEIELQAYAPSILCQDPNAVAGGEAVSGFCNRFGNFLLLDTVAAFAAALGLSALLFVAIFGQLARTSPLVMRVGFRFSLWFTRFSVVTLILVNSVLLLTSFYFGQAILGEQLNLYSVAAVAFLVGIIGLKNASTALVNFRPRPFKVPGRDVTVSEHPALQQFVADVFRQCEAPHPDHVVAGIDFILFASRAKLNCLGKNLSGFSLFLPLPLCRLLSKAELSALVAHELAHHRGPDARATRAFYPWFEAVLHDLEGMSRAPVRFMTFPVISIFTFLASSFLGSEATVSRRRELAADLYAAEKFGRENLASALVKLYAFTATWDYVEEEMRAFLAEGKQIINSSEFFSTLTTITETEVFLKHIALSTISHPTDHHPLLGERLGALQFTVQDFSQMALSKEARAKIKDPAIKLFFDYAKLEEALTNVDHLRKPHLGIPIAPEVIQMFEPELHTSPEDHDREIA